MSALFDVLTFQAGYNTALVMVGAALLGAAGGVVGCFSVLRKRSLISDAISHATLPGVALGFLAGLWIFGEGRSLPVLIAGAAGTGALGVLVVHWIRDHTRLTEDAAIGTVLSVFFGLGIVLLSYIQTLPVGGQAGLSSFLLGSTAAMTAGEAMVIATASVVVIAVCVVFLKELGLVCFDPSYAASLGWPVARIDLGITGLLLAVVAVGLKTVGLVLVVALVIVPAVSARFWTDRLALMLPLAGFLGASACFLGAALSAVVPDMPTGALIVLLCGGQFAVGMLFAPRRGVIAHAVRRRRFRRRLAMRQGLLALYRGAPPDAAGMSALLTAGHIDASGAPTEVGRAAARATAFDQLLWDRFLAERPDDALTLPEWGVETIDRVLPADLVDDLREKIVLEGTRP